MARKKSVAQGPVYLKVIVWAARVLALGSALFALYVTAVATAASDREILVYLLPQTLLQLAEWKWAWQGGAAVAALVLFAGMAGPRNSYLVLMIFAIPTVLFLLHRALSRRLPHAARD